MSNNNNNNKTRNKPMCVLCHVPLYKMEEDYQWRCPNQKCRKVYQLYYEVMAYESDFQSIYNEEEDNLEHEGLEGSQSSPALVVADNEFDEYDSNNKNPTTRSDITIPDYMKPGPGQRLVEFKETIEED